MKPHMHLFIGLVLALLASCAFGQADSITASDGTRMVLIPAGAFMMGSGQGLPEEMPPHQVNLPGFYIDQTEVTNAQYAAFLKATKGAPPTHWPDGAMPKGRENFPITNITWFDAMRYAIWAGKRLPTEAEWEKAARGTDGRRYPWGNSDDKSRRSLDSTKLTPVGSQKGDVSPFGILDMSGNAYEWTADWFDAYPGSATRLVQFGKKYKVFRGGAAEYYYALQNNGTTTVRLRALPYGSHDYIGFRCVRSIDPANQPYDPKKALAEAEAQLNASLKKPVELSYEKDFAALLNSGKVPFTVVGAADQSGIVRAGVPLPQGLIKDVAQLGLMNSANGRIPVQTSILSRWQDGSARWALLTFPARSGDALTLDLRAEPAGNPKAVATQNDDGIIVDMPGQPFRIRKADLSGRIRMELDTGVMIESLPAEMLELEESGGVQAVVRCRGVLADSGKPSAFLYEMRLYVPDGSGVRGVLTITHKAARNITVNVRRLVARIPLNDAPTSITFGTDGQPLSVQPAKTIQLVQSDDLQYQILRDGQALHAGTRAPGWVSWSTGQRTGFLGISHFWQNHPQSITITPEAVELGIWAGKEPFDWEGGLAKSVEFVLGSSASAPQDISIEPLRISLPPAWSCGTNALGAPLLPRGKEAVERFPYWELFRESSMREWVRGMPTGLRHFGDAYMGGPYKGKNAYSNLEYDVHYNFLMEYLRTGQTWYLDSAVPMARHQADIDTYHITGQPWKHSPGHTTTEAELGHVFVRGLCLHYLLTGDRRSLDVAREIGDWIAATLEKGQGTGNERQIGWGLYALTAIYEITADPKYLHACETLCNRLLKGQANTGQFTNIRWDNRISFFNGIAMNGMLGVYEHTRDEKLAEGILKVAYRTLGMYPEYACRTLNAFIWAARRTNDPRFLDAIERTWELSQEYLPEAISTDTHAWHFRAFAAKYDLFPLAGTASSVRLNPKTWRGVRFQKPDAEMYIRPTGGRSAAIMIVREGHAGGSAEIFNAAGESIQRIALNDVMRTFEAGSITLPGSAPLYRIRLRQENHPKARAWQVHYDDAAQVSVFDPTGSAIPDIYRRAFARVEDGATSISIKLEAMGEGFHMAALYDADGKPVKVVRHFVDFEDPGRYELELKLESKTALDSSRPWSVEVFNTKVLSVKGLVPYWAPSADQLFNPEQGR